MKLIGNIEVSGIKRIVFYNTQEAWVRSEPDEDGKMYWFLEDGSNANRVRDHDNMIKAVQRKVWDPEGWRVWIHGETMNFEPLDN